MADVWRSPCGTIELYRGRWQDRVFNVKADACIFDPPYSKKTHEGHDTTGELGRSELNYSYWTKEDIDEFYDHFSPRMRGWIVAMTSHDMIPDWEMAADRNGRYGFAPIPYIEIGSRCRLQGDGPSNWTIPVFVARPRTKEFAAWGTLPGAYIQPKGYLDRGKITGGKTEWIMRSLIRDYSRKGDLVVDPCAGQATTLVAAAIEGRRAIGCEVSKETFDLAVRRLKKGWTPSLF